jgi:hypothetical protein
MVNGNAGLHQTNYRNDAQLGLTELIRSATLQTFGAIVMMKPCKPFSKQPVEWKDCAASPMHGIIA